MLASLCRGSHRGRYVLGGAAFLATAVWGQGAAAENRNLAVGIGLGLVVAGLLSQVRTDDASTNESDELDDAP